MGPPALGIDRDSQPRSASPTECRAHGPSAVGASRPAVDAGVAAMAGTRHVDATIRRRVAGTMAGFERRGARRGPRGLGAALDFRLYASRAFCADGLEKCPAIAFELRAKRNLGTGSANAFHGAQRLSRTDRLFGRRDSHVVGAPAGNVRLEPDAERRRGPAALAAEITVAGPAPGANHPGSREFLESWIS